MKTKKNVESKKNGGVAILDKAIIPADAMRNMKFVDPNGKTKFTFAPSNRDIIPRQVTKLADSINNMGIIRPLVCTEVSFLSGDKQLVVIDGQHLLLACMRLGATVPYVIIPVNDKKEFIEKMALLNASSKSWTMLDYIKAWSELIQDYVKLKRYYNTYDLDLGVISAVLSGRSADGGNVTKQLKRGLFRIVDETDGVKLLDCITDVLDVAPRMNRFENRYLCYEYIKFYKSCKKYNHEKFMNNLKKAKKQLNFVTHEQDALQSFFRKLN